MQQNNIFIDDEFISSFINQIPNSENISFIEIYTSLLFSKISLSLLLLCILYIVKKCMHFHFNKNKYEKENKNQNINDKEINNDNNLVLRYKSENFDRIFSQNMKKKNQFYL